MKNLGFVALGVVLGCLLLSSSGGRNAAVAQLKDQQAVQAWEYEFFQGNPQMSGQPLRGLGAQGWELCGVVPGERQFDALYIFKRPKQ